jgi:hypothetical protein
MQQIICNYLYFECYELLGHLGKKNELSFLQVHNKTVKQILY